MDISDYPALFVNADAASQAKQRSYLRSLLGQYALLLMAACTTVAPNPASLQAQSALYLLFVLGAGALLLHMSLREPQKEWYEARAMAESIKTLTWRYMMHSVPFGTGEAEGDARLAFKTYIGDLVDANRRNGSTLATALTFGPQITPEMQRVRALPLMDRKAIYLDRRIRDQLAWYRNKARWNQSRSALLAKTCAALYIAGILVAFYQLTIGTMIVQFLSEPILVTAAAMIGWMQAKRYSELAASYTLAAHEIAQIEHNIEAVASDADFDTFVTEAEFAFSREHTQWIARQTAPAG